MMLVVACSSPGSLSMSAARPTPPAAPQSCANHHVHGTIRDASSRQPAVGIQVSVSGDDGQDDTETDADGHFDVRSTASGRDELVVFYAGSNITRQLSTTRCDENVDMDLGLRASSPGFM